MKQQLNRQYKPLEPQRAMDRTTGNQIQEKPRKDLYLNKNIEQKVNERTIEIVQIAKELAARNKELKRANKQLESFAYTVSHDLQEPLRSISLFTQLLEQEYTEKLDEQGQEYIGFITNSAMRMQTLVRDVLAYARAATNEETWLNVDLNGLVQTLIIDLQAIIQETEAKIVVDRLPTVLVNPTEISQLLRNLITNSLKFRSERKPCIKIASQLKDNQWLITVEDNGIGIEPQYRDKIFQPFSRLHSQDQYSGSGIGLAICKKIVERYRGIIGVKSKPGQGSTFYFTLPQSTCPIDSINSLSHGRK